ncbi:hypothetical protein AKJ09_05282 [Labilithrix luteola]|uniref:Uncharacterized protein n=1 Tax=Labilithrix luteola TaxID=1391654 RepID=A0A0K1PYL0_9BACT|nr:hypothetical protein AKJ09_05282 [Labilithrix luteola]
MPRSRESFIAARNADEIARPWARSRDRGALFHGKPVTDDDDSRDERSPMDRQDLVDRRVGL